MCWNQGPFLYREKALLLSGHYGIGAATCWTGPKPEVKDRTPLQQGLSWRNKWEAPRPYSCNWSQPGVAIPCNVREKRIGKCAILCSHTRARHRCCYTSWCALLRSFVFLCGFAISEFCSNASTGHSRGDLFGISFSSFAQFLFVLICQNSGAFVSLRSFVRSFVHGFLMNKVMLLSLPWSFLFWHNSRFLSFSLENCTLEAVLFSFLLGLICVIQECCELCFI